MADVSNDGTNLTNLNKSISCDLAEQSLAALQGGQSAAQVALARVHRLVQHLAAADVHAFGLANLTESIIIN